jgi:hypothetical protein
MKSSKLILAIWLAASAWAQAPPPKQQVKPPAAAHPNGARTLPLAEPSPMPRALAHRAGAAASAAPESRTAHPANLQGKPFPGSAKAAAAEPSGQLVRGSGRFPAEHRRRLPAQTVAPVSGRRHGRVQSAAARFSANRAVAAEGKPGHKGRRDPFVSPIMERSRNATHCTGSGRQCLVVGEISLHGVVRSPSGVIAVVMNGDHTYFLRVNDPLADGAVAKITGDAITLRQRTTDALGRPFTREVTKKLGAPAA